MTLEFSIYLLHDKQHWIIEAYIIATCDIMHPRVASTISNIHSYTGQLCLPIAGCISRRWTSKLLEWIRQLL